jgi:hypothetical protein
MENLLIAKINTLLLYHIFWLLFLGHATKNYSVFCFPILSLSLIAVNLETLKTPWLYAIAMILLAAGYILRKTRVGSVMNNISAASVEVILIVGYIVRLVKRIADTKVPQGAIIAAIIFLSIAGTYLRIIRDCKKSLKETLADGARFLDL